MLARRHCKYGPFHPLWHQNVKPLHPLGDVPVTMGVGSPDLPDPRVQEDDLVLNSL